MGGSLGRNLGGAQGGVPQFFFLSQVRSNPDLRDPDSMLKICWYRNLIWVETQVIPRVVPLERPPLGPPRNFFRKWGGSGPPSPPPPILLWFINKLPQFWSKMVKVDIFDIRGVDLYLEFHF